MFWKKKKKPIERQKIDFTHWRMNLNMKVIMYWEYISEKSFLQLEGEEDVLKVIYSMIVTNNEEHFTYEVFKIMLENSDFATYIANQIYLLEDTFTYLLKSKERNNTTIEKPKDDKVVTFTEICNYLMVNGIDARYVAYDLKIYELFDLVDTLNKKYQNDIEMDRYWAFLKVATSIGGSKIKSPQDIMKFPWEENNKKQKALDEIEKKRKALNKLFKIEEDAGRFDDSSERE